ncbi:MAG: type II toxin-antitoxin system HicA family toxin [Crenarchaeota archaeon]|nr:type II toxin-antitoxin system HicA family toxin [Thermoproteota archaeon]
MSEKLPSVSWRKVTTILRKAGFKVVHQKGSHMFLTDGKHKVTVPRHDPVKKGTREILLGSILLAV